MTKPESIHLEDHAGLPLCASGEYPSKSVLKRVAIMLGEQLPIMTSNWCDVDCDHCLQLVQLDRQAAWLPNFMLHA